MILADTSIWADHFRRSDKLLSVQIAQDSLLMHPYVIAELCLGWLRQREGTIMQLEALPSVQIARVEEVRYLIESKALYGRGVGLIDVHLLASCYINRTCQLWTRDKSLRAVAHELGVHANPA